MLTGCGSVDSRSAGEQDLARVRKMVGAAPFLVERWAFPIGEPIRWCGFVGADLVVETTSPRLYALDGASGTVRWINELPRPLDFPPAGNSRHLYLLIEGECYLLSRESGAILKRSCLPFAPSSPPAVSEGAVLIGGWDNFLYALDAGDLKKVWRHLLKGEVRVPPCPTEELVYFGGEDGAIGALETATGLLRWKEMTGGAAVATPVSGGKSVFFTSADTHLYVREPATGIAREYFSLESRAVAPPVIAGNRVMIITEERELLIFERGQGNHPIARIPGCLRYFLTAPKSYWVAVGGGELMRLDPARLEALDRTKWEGVIPAAAQRENGWLVLVSRAGTLVLVEER